MRILIVEDSSLARNMLRGEVKIHFPEAHFIAANNGQLGLDKYLELFNANQAPELVFLDQLMPEMDGIEAAKEILKINPKAYLVMVTANIQASTEKEALGIGVKHFLNKPIDRVRLAQVVSHFQNEHQ
ncbi:MAG: hypothetical protein A2508_01425 [Candidatus Lambdaproteobacteria bacterium RIFOXYD12_FULL_49_8]|uniref:Response regulatory domain-containing protein n=1 Tax=Candidatus Lambdaproteobacteria bacterium RIFOXYD2_FULL_50_16 TaxID=1817772 RepID=A0A1F6G599_9PROT|nr:MAG: hypothetical protein A2527_13700 [Candidatus Lambdaproteobacteria bacterium RIFOXYD2_FULL_50_16]OGG97706.1 MAG: hypothetical protein A2508_01425 [Candidatus Lambdaproteobacteria bacterium RIFOXYD12_FULL_49_8]